MKDQSNLRHALQSILNRRIRLEADQSFFQNAFNDCPGNANTRKGRRGKVNAFLGWLYRQGYLKQRLRVDITMNDVIELRNTETVRYLSWQQVSDIVSAHLFLRRQRHSLLQISNAKPKEFYPDMWWFMFYSLLRKEEVAKLNVSDLVGNKLRVQGKGRRTDTIVLPPPALSIIQTYTFGKRPEDPIFTTHMNRSGKHFATAIELALGSDHAKGFHQLRHGGIVHYLTLGKPIQFVSKLARHRSIQVTLEVYADVMPDGMESIFSDVTHGPATGDTHLMRKD